MMARLAAKIKQLEKPPVEIEQDPEKKAYKFWKTQPVPQCVSVLRAAALIGGMESERCGGRSDCGMHPYPRTHTYMRGRAEPTRHRRRLPPPPPPPPIHSRLPGAGCIPFCLAAGNRTAAGHGNL